MSQLQNTEKKIKKRQQQNLNRQYKATNLKPLRKGDTVQLPDRKCKGTVIQNYASRSCVARTDEQGTYRRNCKKLLRLPLPFVGKTIKPNTNTSKTLNKAKRPVVAIPIEEHPTSQHPENHQVTKTRSERVSKPPESYTS